MKNAAPHVARMPEVIYHSLHMGEGLRAEPEWHQLQLLRIAEEARRAATASGRHSLGAAREYVSQRDQDTPPSAR